MHRQFTSSSNGEEEFTVEELQEFAQAFKMFDKNGDGTMNIKELGVAMRTLGLNPTEEELLNIVNEYDVDGNGKIDFGEFCKMMKGWIFNSIKLIKKHLQPQTKKRTSL
jgi:calmodulin